MKTHTLPTLTATLLVLSSLSAMADDSAATPPEPYVIANPALNGQVKTRALLTVGDTVEGYRMVGVPDGLGIMDSGPETFTLLLNHELPAGKGIVRQHGADGAFVSRWTFNKHTLDVLAGQDNTTSVDQVHMWDPVTQRHQHGSDGWRRFCSADLAAPGAFAYRDLGTRARLYLNGEEYDQRKARDHGRAFAHIVSGENNGQVWQLPWLGRIAFENVLAHPHPQPKTIVVGMDDAGLETHPDRTAAPSELYLYIGEKTHQGNEIERAGLTNGSLFGIRVFVNNHAVTEESNHFGLGARQQNYVGAGRFYLHNFGDVSAMTGVALQDAAIEAGITRLQRIEDGVWDPRPHFKNDFYFVTTGKFKGEDHPANRASRLWRLRFDDIRRPEAGGSLQIVLKGDEGEGFHMLDNITMDRLGRIVMQEDVGNNKRLGKIWIYDTASNQLREVAAHNPNYFLDQGQPGFLTQNEESSGIVDASQVLGDGWFLLSSQAHYNIGDKELVRGGQILALYIDPALFAKPHSHHRRLPHAPR